MSGRSLFDTRTSCDLDVAALQNHMSKVTIEHVPSRAQAHRRIRSELFLIHFWSRHCWGHPVCSYAGWHRLHNEDEPAGAMAFTIDEV